jgi:hypothetical protein
VGSPLFCLPSLKKRTQHFLFCVQVLKEGRGGKENLKEAPNLKKKKKRDDEATQGLCSSTTTPKGAGLRTPQGSTF